MTLYRRKSEIVEAYKWMPTTLTMEDKHPIPEWLANISTVNGNNLEIWGLGGIQRAYPNNWVVKDKRNKIHILTAEAFDVAYEAMHG